MGRILNVGQYYGYLEGVIDGSIPAPSDVIRQAKVISQDFADSRHDPESTYYFDEEGAGKLIDGARTGFVFVDGLKEGQPLEFTPFQLFFLLSLLFWKRRDNDELKHNEALFLIAKKQGKSFLMAFLGIYLIMKAKERGAFRFQGFVAANSENQADGIIATMKVLIKASPIPQIRNAFKLTKEGVFYTSPDYAWKPTTSRVNTKDGENIDAFFGDECWGWQDDAIYQIWRQGFGGKRNQLFILVSSNGPRSGFLQHHANNMFRKNIYIDDSGAYRQHTPKLFGLMYLPDPDDQPEDEKTWFKLCPNLGIGLDIEVFRSDFHLAVNAGDGNRKYNDFINKRLNYPLTSSVSWFQDNKIAPNFCLSKDSISDFEGQDVLIYVDLARTEDPAGYTLSFFDDETQKQHTFFRFWVLEKTLDRRQKTTGMPWKKWASNGDILTMPGDELNHKKIVACIAEEAKRFNVKWIWLDGALSQLFEPEIKEKLSIPCATIPQTITPWEKASALFEYNVNNKTFLFEDNGFARWTFTNAVLAYGKKPVKPKDENLKVDPIQCAVMSNYKLFEENAYKLNGMESEQARENRLYF